MSEYADTVDRWNYMEELLSNAEPARHAEKKRKYISRIERPDKSAFYWRVDVDIKDKHYTKSFCDKKCGGSASALLGAIAYRDKILKEQNIVILKEHKVQPFNPDAKGVYFKNKTCNGYTYPYMLAYWQEEVNGKQQRRYKAFSINKHGEKKAARLAKKFRAEKLKELYG